MASSSEAVKDHREMFPGHSSTLAKTDPELIEDFDNLAFDHALAESNKVLPTRLMVQLAAMIAVQKLVVGSARVESMNAGAPAEQKHSQQFLAANCFGDHYTRSGINVPTREQSAWGSSSTPINEDSHKLRRGC